MKHRMNPIWLAVAIMLLGAGLAPRAEAGVSATGGNYTNDIPGYRIHVFTNSATASNFVVSAASPGDTVQVLVVGGGGGGGTTAGGGYAGGGGGAGGLLMGTTNITVTESIPVVVGNGGTNANGQSSSFGALTAFGGGKGGDGTVAGSSGGSGGGGGASGSPYKSGGGGTNGQGNAGGTGFNGSSWSGGGGGGAGGPGGNASSTVVGNGGGGTNSAITGVLINYAGGGGGGYNSYGPGTVTGGGGVGGGYNQDGIPGTNGTGGGGGGGGDGSGNGYKGGAGGSGIVIVRYALQNWSCCMPITFTNDARLNTLTNFPALVIFDTTKVNYSQFQANGQDLRFMDGSGAELRYEVESWMSTNSASSNSFIWVQIPTMTAGCSITAYWGNASATLPSYRTDGSVWDANYRGVWHYTNGTVLGAGDATANRNAGTLNGSPVATNGVVDGAARFTGASGCYVDNGNPASLQIASDITVSAWISTTATDMRSIASKYVSSKGWELFIDNGTAGNVYFGGGEGGAYLGSGYSAASVNDGKWHHVAGQRSGTSWRTYVDGVLSSSANQGSGASIHQTVNCTVGRMEGAYEFPGGIDEVRISAMARSTNWLWAECVNQGSNTSFNTYGAVGSTSGGPVTYKLPMAFTNYTRAEVLTNFPVLVVFSNGLYGTFDYSKFTSPTNGGDLRFWDSTETTSLDFEIESWNTNGASYAWVRVPLLSSNTTIYAKWGGSDTTLPACTTNGAVWTNGFVGVWHMGETSSPVLDWARGSGNGSNVGAGVVYGQTGQVNRAVQMTQSGGNGGVKVADCNALDFGSGSFAVEMWERKEQNSSGWNNIGAFNKWWSGGSPGTNEWTLDTCVGGNDNQPIFSVEIGTTTYSCSSPNSIVINTWNHIVGVRDGTTLRIYVNGAENGSQTGVSGSVNNAGRDLYFGYFPALPSYSLRGRIDEARASNVARSSNWVWACYANIASNAFFNGYGTVATVSGGSGTPPGIQNRTVSGVTTGGATFNGTLTSTGTSACAVGVLWGTDTSSWANTNWFNGGAVNPAWTNNTPFSTNITLGSGATYYYTYVASNASGVATASPPVALITGGVTVEATDASANYPSTGTFTIRRPPDLTNATLVVNYTTSGSTAVAGTDYTALSGSATLDPGMSNATVTVSPLRYPDTSRTVMLTLSSGAYATGTPNTATVIVYPRLPICVTTNGTGGGTSWADATSLTNALRICTSNDTIWIAQGTYTNSSTFAIAATNVALYGGFTNGMATLAERDWTNYPTVLDGQGTDRRVVTVSGANVTLDGLVISNSYGFSAGGLSKTVAGLLTLANCRIVQNTAGIGAGLNVSGSVLMTNCVVAGNRAVGITTSPSDKGFGLYASSATLDIVDCIFSNNCPANAWNSRDGWGGGIDFESGNLRVWRTEFIGNSGAAQGWGGGAAYIGGSASFSNCVFRGNSVQGGSGTPGPGGALTIKCGSYTANVVNCTFAHNTNAANGGAIYQESGTLNLRNCILWTNRFYTGYSGSELYFVGGTATVSYCDFTGTNSPYVVTNAALVTWGAGIKTADPLFASATDLHLKSVAGRWNPATSAWVKDTAVSPCIDAGSGSAGNEPDPNGGIINLGAYGGTWQASKSPTPPVITNGALVVTSMNEDAGPLNLATLGLAASDVCDTAWAWTNVAGSGPANGTVAVNGSGTNPVSWTVFTYTPSTNFNGTNSFQVKVTGLTALLSATVTVQVAVNPVSDPPVNTVPPAYTGTTFEAMTQWGVDTGTWNDNADTNATYNGSGLTFTYQWYCSNSPSPIAIANATNATYMVGMEWLGSNLNVAVTCSDTGYPGPSSATLSTGWSKVLAAANTPPVILVNGVPSDSVSTNMNEDGGALSLTGLGLSATDDGGGGPGVTWLCSSQPTHGVASVSGSGTDVVAWTSFTYTPTANFNGTDSFVVQAKDAVNATDSITVTVVVAAINDPPVNTVAPGYTGTRLVGNTLTATNGVWNDDADTNGSYTAANFAGAATFTYQWWRSANASGSPSNAIPGATASTYALTESDRWKYLSVAVTCTDGNYPAGSASNTAFSAWLREASTPPIYVTTTGTGGGTSWADATSLTNALQTAPASNMIWAAQGTYTNSATFTVAINGVSLYGGFTTNMESLTERSWTNYPTALNGQGADRRVVTVSGTNVTLDGLVISNSYGNSAGGLSKSVAGLLTLANCRIVGNTAKAGAGLNLSGSVLMTNCVVAGNRGAGITTSDQGFGLYASAATLDIVDCLFSNNAPVDAWNSRDLHGGGIDFVSGTLRVLRTDFIGNSGAAQGDGGGAAYIGGSASFSNCVFRGNSVQGGSGTPGPGGALTIKCGSYTANVVNCTFAYNTNAANGGAIYQSSGTLNLKNCILWTNRVNAGGNGSELYFGGGTMNVNYCDLTGSGSPYIFGSPTFANCIYSDPLFASATDLHEKSTAGRWDPVTRTFVTTDSQYSPCIDAGDPTDPIGAEPTDNGNVRINMGAYGGLAQASKSPPSVPPQLADRGYTVSYNRARISGELTNATYCSAAVYLCYGTNSVPADTTNGWDGVLSLGDKQNGTVFAQWTPALLASTTYYYRWYAVNNNGGVWTPAASFLSGAAAPGGGTNVVHVNKDATGAGDGTSWPHAYTKIIDGLAAVSGARSNVWITAQVYSEGTRLDFGSSATIVGGFAGTESAVSQRAGTNALGVVTNYTAINGESAHGCLNVTAGSATLDTLTFSNAVMTGNEYGGLRWSSSGSLVANNCRFVQNRGNGGNSAHGLAVKATAGNVLLTSCVVADNLQNAYSSYGFGIYSVGANLALVDCVVRNNGGEAFATRSGIGAGLYFDNGALAVGRTDFLSNTGGLDGASVGGGAVYLGPNANTTASFTNCVFRGNQVTVGQGSAGFGGALCLNLASLSRTVTVANCTFADNRNDSTGGAGGAVYVSKGTLVLKNAILWTNTVQDGLAGRELYATSANSRVSISYSDFTGTNTPHVVAAGGATVQWGAGILTADPLYAGATDVHLKSDGGRWDAAAGAWVIDPVTSPCIDAGDPADPVGAESEPNRNRINMGAYGGTAQASRSAIPRGSVFKFR